MGGLWAERSVDNVIAPVSRINPYMLLRDLRVPLSDLVPLSERTREGHAEIDGRKGRLGAPFLAIS